MRREKWCAAIALLTEPGWIDGTMELLVDTEAYGVPGLNWCRYSRRAPGTASGYPIKVLIPGRGEGQYTAAEVVGVRRNPSVPFYGEER